MFGSSDEVCCPKHCKLLCKAEMEETKKASREAMKELGEGGVKGQQSPLSKKERRANGERQRRNSRVTELKTKLEGKQAQVKKEKERNDKLTTEKTREMDDLVMTLSEVEDARDAKRRASSQLDENISSSESKLAQLLKQRQSLVSECGKTYKQIEKLSKKKERLERTRDIEMEAYLEEKQSMKQEIESMYRRIEDLEENDSGCLETSGPSDTTWMVKFLEQVAADKEKDLECPVKSETESSFCDQLLFSDLPRDCNGSNFQLPGEPRDMLPMQTKVGKKKIVSELFISYSNGRVHGLRRSFQT